MDERIERRLGESIASIFATRGEEAFRAEERREAGMLAQVEDAVVATGGGAFTREATRAALSEGALTVWLRCDLETILARLPDDGSRPLAGDRGIMQTLLAEREPSYRRADIAVDASRGTPAEVAEQVADLIERRTAGDRPTER
jgi:shikimate kinase